MKKTSTLLISFLLLTDAFAQCNINSSSGGPLSELVLGTSVNALDEVSTGTRLWADPALNTVVFIMRDINSSLVYDISTNGGVTWNLGQGPLYLNSTDTIRNPHGGLVNPSGVLHQDSAYVVFASNLDMQGSTDPVVHGHKQVVAGSLASSITDSTFYQHGPSDMVITKQGVIWTVEGMFYNGVYNQNLILTKGVWNPITRVFDYTTNLLGAPVGPMTNFEPAYLTSRIAFSPDGQTGYVVVCGHEVGALNVDSVFFPTVFKTTNGGVTWITGISLDLSPVDSCLNLGTSRYTMWNQFDLAVDKFGELHILANILEGDNHWGAINVSGHYGIFDIFSSSTSWKTRYVSRPQSCFGLFGGPPFISELNRTQIAIDSSGEKLFYVWVETDTATYGTNENLFPDLHVVGYDVVSQTCTDDLNITGGSGTTADGGCLFHDVSYYAFTGAGD